jgi:hypothetical protein
MPRRTTKPVRVTVDPAMEKRLAAVSKTLGVTRAEVVRMAILGAGTWYGQDDDPEIRLQAPDNSHPTISGVVPPSKKRGPRSKRSMNRGT